ncbi:MAG: CaiB/BaiF CoA transferase family protein [Gammaproteobacteria bacterium]
MAALPKHILNGYRILDMTHVLAGPTATRLMAEMGAEVIKVEFPPLGDVSRALPGHRNGRSAYYAQQNRGKYSICLNAKADEGKAILRELIAKSDVFIENFAPGVIGRLGFGWEQVHALNPNIVMCSISALGQEGELSALPGFDYIAQAYSGIMGMIGEPGGPPSFPMAGMGDVMTGVHAAAAIGFALLHRERGGEGTFLDISLLDAYTHCHELNVQIYSMTDGATQPTRSGHHHFAVCPLGLFKGREDWICIIALQPQWPAVCRAIGRPDLIDDPRYDTNEKRCAASQEVIDIIQAWVDAQPSDKAILAALERERVPCAPVLTIEQLANHPHMRGRGTIRTISDPKLGEVLMPGMPLRFKGFPHNPPLDAAALGEHNGQVLTEILGYDAARVAALGEAGVLFSNPDT